MLGVCVGSSGVEKKGRSEGVEESVGHCKGWECVSISDRKLLTFFKQGRKERRYEIYKGPNPMARRMHVRRLTASEIWGSLKGDYRFERYSGG